MNNYLNGNTASVAIKGAIALLFLLIVSITVIILQGEDIPDIFTILIGTLSGFLAGSRVVTDSVKESVIEKDKTDDRL